jgi:hypothetical protein
MNAKQVKTELVKLLQDHRRTMPAGVDNKRLELDILKAILAAIALESRREDNRP